MMLATLVAVLCLGAGASARRHSSIQYMLPRTAAPYTYALDLTVNIPTSNTFTGEVTISLYPIHKVSHLTLHVDHDVLTITSATLYKGTSLSTTITISSMTNDTEMQTTTFWLASTLALGTKYQLVLDYTGTLREDMLGFYRTTYTNSSATSVLAATQFAPTYARSAFPCWDEPEYKATFTVSLTHNSSYTALSNMVTSSTESSSDTSGYTVTEFDESTEMSTYLVSFLISDYGENTSSTTTTTTFSVWARSDVITQADYALEVGESTLEQLETYLDFTFSNMLSKLDMVAVPDMAVGALDNWGLISFRESELMYKANESSESDKERVALAVAHEEALMWSSGLVSPSWWSFSWISQGLARYLQYVAVNLVETDWGLMNTYIVNSMMSALEADSLQTSHALTTTVFSPLEVRGVFDSITYDKGAAIMHMVLSVLGTSNFTAALYTYLTEMENNVATPRDLFRNFDSYQNGTGLSSSVNFTTMLDTWTSEPGYPLINVQVNGSTANITQSRYFTNGTNASSTTKWWVPLTYTTQSLLNFGNSTITWLDPSNEYQEVSVNSSEWVIFNIKHKGFYRVNYDNTTWGLIIAYLQNSSTYDNIHLLNRAQLLDDALALARSGTLNYTFALNLTKYLEYEVDPVPWMAAFRQLNYIASMLYNTSAASNFKSYVVPLLSEVYEEIGFNDSSSDNHTVLTFRTHLLYEACNLGVENCTESALTAFDALKASNDSVSPGARRAVYCAALRNSSSTDDWDYLYDRYNETDIVSERMVILGALGCTTDSDTLTAYLNMTLSPGYSTIRAQDAEIVFKSVLNGNPGNFDVAYEFLVDNFETMVNTTSYSTLGTMGRVIQSIAEKITTQARLTEFEAFLKANSTYVDLLLTETELSTALETAQSNVAWRTAHLYTVTKWLAEVTASSAVAPGASLWWPAALLLSATWLRISFC